MKKEEELEVLYQIQLTSGCDKIRCKNVYCSHCKDFIYQKEVLTKDKIKELTQSLSKGHLKCPRLCDSTRGLLFDQAFLSAQQQICTLAKSNMIDDLKTVKNAISRIFLSPRHFSNILKSNEFPLSDTNSSIDDNFFFEFSTKLSKISEVDTEILAGIYMVARTITETKRFFDFYSNIRCLVVLFYFPTILSPDIKPPILFLLLKKMASIKKEQLCVFLGWLSKLTNLRRQMVGYIHSAISLYYSEHSNPNPHSDSLHTMIKAMGMLHAANEESEDPLPVTVFYDDHINESISIENELDLLTRNNMHGRYASLLKKSPFILSLKMKAEIYKVECKQLMELMAHHSMMLSTQSRYTTESYLTLRIRRSNLLKDAVDKLSHQDSKSFLKKLKVVFEGESAVDVGGPSREFLYLISEKLFSPDLGMFVVVNDKFSWFSHCSFESERSFFLIGAVVGLAIHNSVVLPIRFPLVIYKLLLHSGRNRTSNSNYVGSCDNVICSSSNNKDSNINSNKDNSGANSGNNKNITNNNSNINTGNKNNGDVPNKNSNNNNKNNTGVKVKLNLADLAEIDPETASSLRALKELRFSGGDVRAAMLDFTATTSAFDVIQEEPLVEDLPMETEVTNDNLDLYVQSYIDFTLVRSVHRQFEAFRKGFETTCRAPSYRFFEPEELDILVSGVEVLDWGALQRSTTYSDGYKESSKQVKWFWEVFREFSKEEKLSFLKFATGTDRAPIGGLGCLKLVIQRVKDKKMLPVSHTCFNIFSLPKYSSKAVLEQKVKLAIQYTEGFGIR